MRQFTDAEKQELKEKIKDEQERQKQLVEELAQQKDGAPRRLSTAGKYVYLGFVLCLLAFKRVYPAKCAAYPSRPIWRIDICVVGNI